MESTINLRYLASAIVYSFLGIAVLTVAFVTFDKFTPGNMWKEVIEKNNIAVAIISAAMMLSIAHIIASAIHG